jgi:hypothetical protein
MVMVLGGMVVYGEEEAGERIGEGWSTVVGGGGGGRCARFRDGGTRIVWGRCEGRGYEGEVRGRRCGRG